MAGLAAAVIWARSQVDGPLRLVSVCDNAAVGFALAAGTASHVDVVRFLLAVHAATWARGGEVVPRWRPRKIMVLADAAASSWEAAVALASIAQLRAVALPASWASEHAPLPPLLGVPIRHPYHLSSVLRAD